MSDLLDREQSQRDPIMDDGKPSWQTHLQSADDDALDEIRGLPEAGDDDLPVGHPSRKKSGDSESVGGLKTAEEGGANGAGSSGTNEESRLGALEHQIGDGFKSAGGGRAQLAAKLFGGNRRRNTLIGGGIAGTIVTLIITAFVALLPLKVVHIMENIQNKYFGSTQSAVSKRTEKIFSDYLREHVMPGMKGNGVCRSSKTINKDCIAPITGDSIADRAFRGWRDGRLENKLADNYGLEFERRKDDKVYMKISGVSDGIDISDLESGKKLNLTDFEQVNRSQIRAQVDKALQGETYYKRVLYRLKVARLLKEKYGTKLCVFACKLGEKRDELTNWTNKKINGKKVSAFDLVLNKNVLSGRAEILGIAMGCIIDSSCDSNAPSRNLEGCESCLEKQDLLQQKVADRLAERGINLSKESLDEVVKQVQKISESPSFGQYLATELASKVVGEKLAESGVPIIGWINFGSQIVGQVQNAGPKIQRWGFAISSATAVAAYTTYLTGADEMKVGATNSDIIGSMTTALGDTAGDATHQGQPAESSPLYQDVFGAKTTSATAFLNILSPQTVLAAGQKDPSYTCDDGSKPTAAEVICPEEKLLQGVGLFDSVSKAFDSPPLNVIAGISGIWNATFGKAFGVIGQITGSITSTIVDNTPGLKQAQDQLGEWAGDLMTLIGKEVFPSALGVVNSGARLIDTLFAGGDSAGNDYAHYGLGGQKLNTSQVAAIQQDQQNQEDQQFASQPVFARMFDTNDTKSLISQVAMSVPTNTTVAMQSGFASLLSNPFSKLTSGFGSIFTTHKVSAASGLDPFGVPQYGYDLNDPAFNVDSKVYTDAYCKQQDAQWVASVKQDPVTGLDYHTTTNPCQLEKAAVTALGATFTDEVLPVTNTTPDNAVESQESDLGFLGGVADKIQPIAGDTSNLTCGAGTDAGIGDGYRDGKLYKIRLCKVQGVTVNAQIAKNVDALLNAAHSAGLQMSGGGFRTMDGQVAARSKNGCPDIYNSPSSSCKTPTARPGYSNHQMGLAIDFTVAGSLCNTHATPCYQWLNGHANSFGLYNFPKEAWHWSVDGK